jgi:hypothetical protein
MWRCYLEGSPKFTVITDHNPLIWLIKHSTAAGQRRSLVRFLFDFQYCIVLPTSAHASIRFPELHLKDQDTVPLHDERFLLVLDDNGLTT